MQNYFYQLSHFISSLRSVHTADTISAVNINNARCVLNKNLVSHFDMDDGMASHLSKELSSGNLICDNTRERGEIQCGLFDVCLKLQKSARLSAGHFKVFKGSPWSGLCFDLISYL